MLGIDLKKIKSFLTNTAVQLILIIIFSIICGNMLPYNFLSISYGISLMLKEILVFVLPFIIFSSIFSCLLSFQGKAFLFVAFVFLAVTLSNFVATLAAYGISMVSLPIIGDKITLTPLVGKTLVPIWSYDIPDYIANDMALLAGLIGGVIFAVVKVPVVEKMADKLKNAVTFFLEKMFIPVLPIFALGFILKLKYEGLLEQILITYGPILAVVVGTYFVYLFALFFIAAKFNLAQCFSYIKNVFPASIMAFSSMSSMATLPLTMRACEKNTGETDLVRAICPATVNTHLIGDSLAVPIFALAILVSFAAPLPSFESYFLFTLSLMLIKFAVAAVPGGGILMLIPALQTYIGLDAEMSALIISMYILFDPLLATANVTGNNAFTIMLVKIFNFWSGKKTA